MKDSDKMRHFIFFIMCYSIFCVNDRSQTDMENLHKASVGVYFTICLDDTGNVSVRRKI